MSADLRKHSRHTSEADTQADTSRDTSEADTSAQNKSRHTSEADTSAQNKHTDGQQRQNGEYTAADSVHYDGTGVSNLG